MPSGVTATARGLLADGDGWAGDGVGGGVDHRHRVVTEVGDVGAGAVRGHRHRRRSAADSDRVDDGGVGGVDHRHRGVAGVGDVGAGAVRGHRHPDGLVPTPTASVTVLVVVSITDTELSLKLVT